MRKAIFPSYPAAMRGQESSQLENQTLVALKIASSTASRIDKSQIGMADPIGIALGAAGLLGLFSTCVDLVDRMGKACSYGNDFTILSVKFEAERARLILWGESAGIWLLYSPLACEATPFHPNLTRPEISNAVCRTLGMMQNIFHDAYKLLQRHDAEPTTSSSALLHSSPANVIAEFTKSGQKERERATNQQGEAKISKSFSWVFRDREAAESLIKNLNDFNNLLAHLVPISLSPSNLCSVVPPGIAMRNGNQTPNQGTSQSSPDLLELKR
jgi:hypothetical protein